MQTTYIAAVAAAAFAVLCWFNISAGSDGIQADLTARAERALEGLAEQVDPVHVMADGRDLVLTGIVATAAARTEAGARLGRLWGARTVTNHIELAAPVDLAAQRLQTDMVPYRLTLLLTPTAAVLGGAVRDERTRTALLDIISSRSGAGEIRDELAIEPYTHPQWSDVTQQIAQAIVALDEVEVRFAPNEVVVTGRAGSRDERNRVLAAIRSAVPYGVILRTDLAVPLSAAATRCQQRFVELLERQPMIFLTNTSALISDSGRLFDAFAVAAQQCPAAHIEVAAYSEPMPGAGAALRLSQERAVVIRQNLIARGIPDGRLVAVGRGIDTAFGGQAGGASGTRMPQMALILGGE